MALSNSSILLSENHDLNAMEFTFLLRSTFQTDHQYPTLNSEEDDDDDVYRRREGKEETKSQTLSSAEECSKVGEDDNGFRTPTSLDHKIPSILRCPLAPRKPKSLPVTKRKTYRRQRLLRDLSHEIQSLFPADFLVGLGRKIKRVRPAV